MVTVDFQNIVNAYIDKLASVYMLPMDEQEEAFSNSKRQFLSELDKLQQKHPLLSHYDSILLATDPEKVIQVIKDNTKGKDSLDCITTCERYYFKFRDFEITQPRIIDLNEKPNMIISTSDNLSDSDYLYEMLLNILLSMPLGLVHISVVNTSLSNKAKRFIQLVSNSAFDVYTNENELAFLRWQMTKRLEQCIAKGNFKGANKEIIVLLDFDLNQRNYAELSKLSERGQEAGIYFVVLATDEDISDSYIKSSLGSKSLLRFKDYHILNCRELVAESIFAKYQNLEQACLNYINQGLPKKDNVQDVATDLGSKMQNQEFQLMLLQEMKAKLDALQKQNKELISKRSETEATLDALEKQNKELISKGSETEAKLENLQKENKELRAKENETEWVEVEYKFWNNGSRKWISGSCDISKEEYLALLNGGLSAQQAFVATQKYVEIYEMEDLRFRKKDW